MFNLIPQEHRRDKGKDEGYKVKSGFWRAQQYQQTQQSHKEVTTKDSGISTYLSYWTVNPVSHISNPQISLLTIKDQPDPAVDLQLINSCSLVYQKATAKKEPL